MNLKKSEKILLAILFVVVIIFVYYQYLLSPTLAKIQTANTNIDNYNSQLSELKRMASENRKLEADLTTLQAAGADSLKAIPNAERAPQIERDVNTLADGAKVTLSSISIGVSKEFIPAISTGTSANSSTAANGNSGTAANKSSGTTANAAGTNNAANKASGAKTMALPVTISISGDYAGIKSFVKALGESTRISMIGSITIAPVSSGKGQGQLAANIVTSYFYLDNGQAVKDDYDFNNAQYGKGNPFN